MFKPVPAVSKLSKQGFTLIEVMVAIAVIGVIGFIMADLISRTFKGGTKTVLIATLKQNGQSALNVIDQEIRNAEAVVCIGSFTPNLQSSLTLIRRGQYIRFTIYYNLAPAQNGYIAQETLTVLNPALDNIEQQAYCDSEFVVDQFADGVDLKLTNTNPVTGVSVTSGSFEFATPPQAGIKDAVSVQFRLGPGVQAGSGFESQVGSDVEFKTTIQLRN